MDESEERTTDQDMASQENGEDNPYTQLKRHLQLLRKHAISSSDNIEQFAHLDMSKLTEVSHPDFKLSDHLTGDDLGSSEGQGVTRGHGEGEPDKTGEEASPKEVGANLEERRQKPSKEDIENQSGNEAVNDGSEDAEFGDEPEDRPCPYKVTWQRKVGETNPPQPYQPPAETFGEEVVQIKISATSGNKREIYVLSDIHLGRPPAVCPGHRQLEGALSHIMAAAAEGKVHSVILLGDIFEMWVQAASETAWTERDLLAHWEADAVCRAFTQAVCRMAEQHGVDVYYVRGNHDHEITAAMIHQLFRKKVRFIPGILLYTITADHQEYRIRFEHGHIWDLMNSYSHADTDCGLVSGRPFAYYVCRLASYRIINSLLVGDGTDKTLQTAKAQFRALLRSAGPDIMKLLCLPDIREDLLSLIIQLALGGSIHGNEVIRMHDGTYVPVGKLPKFNFMERLCEQEGVEKVFQMFLVYLDDFSPLIESCEEDLVVLGHNHHWAVGSVTDSHGRDVLFANSGAWVDAEEVSYLRIVPPTSQEDGVIDVLHYPVAMATAGENSQ